MIYPNRGVMAGYGYKPGDRRASRGNALTRDRNNAHLAARLLSVVRETHYYSKKRLPSQRVTPRSHGLQGH
jgi:hypothetical protein